MNVLNICQRVASLANINVPTTLTNPTDVSGTTLRILFDETGNDLINKKNMHNSNFSFLERVYEFVIQPDQREYALPEDYRTIIGNTLWNTTKYNRARGSLTPQQWSLRRFSYSSYNDYIPEFRLTSSSMNPKHYSITFAVQPVVGENYTLEYLTDFWLIDSGGIRKRFITSDSDEPLFDTELMRLGTLWRIQEKQGQDYGVTLAKYEKKLNEEISNDTGARTLTLANSVSDADEYTDYFETPYF